MARLFLASLLSLFAAAALHAESFTFRFAPVVDRPFVQTVRTTTTMKTDGARAQTRVTTERGTLRFRKTEGGYLLSAATTEASVTVDGKEATDAFTKMLEGVAISYEISDDGELRTVRGYDALLRNLYAAAPTPEARDALAKMLNEEVLVNRARSEWGGRIGSFVGETVEIGDAFEAEEQFGVPTGDTVKYYQTTTIAGKEKCGSATCLRIVFRYHTDPASMKNTLDAVGKVMPKAEPLKDGGMVVTGSGERLIDPQTMQIHRETNERTVRMTVTGPDGSKSTVERTETKEYTFDYGAGRK